MNAVVYYSNTGQSRAVAEHLAERLDYPIADMEACQEVRFDSLVLVCPVYCQDMPPAVRDFLKRITADYLTPVATYGKMCYGNVLFDLQRRFPHVTVAAGAYVPTKHAYLSDDAPFDSFELLAPLVEKVRNPAPVRLPRTYRNPLAVLLPAARSRLGVRIHRTEDCDGCGLCAARCPQGAIHMGITNAACIRCLRCVNECPKGALTAEIRFPLDLYLRKKKVTETVVYL